MSAPAAPPAAPGQPLLNTPATRFAVHVGLMFAGVFFAMEYGANDPTSRSALVAALAAGARAVLGALTSTNPGVGVNLL